MYHGFPTEREREREQGAVASRGNPVVKSTEEKKELLGSMLGNVGALVEDVEKAGIWGLG